MFPNQRDTNKHRVSEQEARCIAQRLVTESGDYFSIETPTLKTFKFKGKDTSRERSAQHDLSLYTSATLSTCAAHLELKQGHRSEKNDDGVQEIHKDLAKLVASGLDALWFHSFPKPTNNELRKLRTFSSAAVPKALAKSPIQETARVVLAFCGVLD